MFLTDELITVLRDYINHKYRKRVRYLGVGKPPVIVIPNQKDSDLIFEAYWYKTNHNHNHNQEKESMVHIYNNLHIKFKKTLDLMGVFFENDTTKRRSKLTFHSFRRWTKSTIADVSSSDYSEWWIGHSGSTYYRKSDKEKFEIFKKLEPYLVFQDYKGLTERSNVIQDRVDSLEQENWKLKQMITQVMEMIQENPKLAHVKPEVLIKKSIRGRVIILLMFF